MSETWCGKICSECNHKEKLNCPGCLNGPGSRFGGRCEISTCVQSKGHSTCDTCGFNNTCSKFRSAEWMPEKRIKNMEEEKLKKEATIKKAQVLGKWLWVLFWLVVPGTIAGVLSVIEAIPALFLTGQIMNVFCSVTYGAILIRISSEENTYRTAGICYLISACVSAILTIINGTMQEPSWTLFISLPAAIVALVGRYNEYSANALALHGVNDTLSGKWEKLWNWEVALLGGMIASLLLTVVIPFLGILVILAAAGGLIVISILKLVYLYRTAKSYRKIY